MGTRAAVEPPWKRLATSSLIPVETKKNGMKTPKPTAWSFAWKNACVIPRSRSTSLSVAPARNAPRIASRPNFDASTTNSASSRKAPRTRISAVVSCSFTSDGGDAHRALEPEDRHADGGDEDEERDQQRELRAEAPRTRPEKKSESSTIGPTSAIDAPATITWPNARRGLARVLEDREDDPEPRRGEDDRDEKRRADEVARPQREADDERERERDGVAGRGQPQHAPAEPVEVDLEPGEQEQEREPDQRQHLHRLVVRGPAEHLRPDHDPEQDLEHDRRQPQPGEADDERREHGDGGDDRDRRERDRHVALDPRHGRPLHPL